MLVEKPRNADSDIVILRILVLDVVGVEEVAEGLSVDGVAAFKLLLDERLMQLLVFVICHICLLIFNSY